MILFQQHSLELFHLFHHFVFLKLVKFGSKILIPCSSFPPQMHRPLKRLDERTRKIILLSVDFIFSKLFLTLRNQRNNLKTLSCRFSRLVSLRFDPKINFIILSASSSLRTICNFVSDLPSDNSFPIN